MKPGDEVAEDDVLVEVMTEKAAVEVPAPVSGKIVSTTGQPGDMVPVGAELVVLETAPAPRPPVRPRRRRRPPAPAPGARTGRRERQRRCAPSGATAGSRDSRPMALARPPAAVPIAEC